MAARRTTHTPPVRRKLIRSIYWLRLLAFAGVVGLLAVPAAAAPEATLLSANFNGGTDGFTYQDDAFGTSQPGYASGTRTTSGGYGGTGGLQVTLGGVDANAITGMSGGWSYTLSLAGAETGVSLSFRYKLDQSATYEYDEYTRMLVNVDGVQYGRGLKNFVDHIGGDGSSSQGNSNSYLPTTDWQQHTIYLGDLAAGGHTLVLGGYNNHKDASDESTTATIDDVAVTSGNAAPVPTAAQTLAGRVSIDQFLADLQGIAQFHDRCRGGSMGCSSADYTTNYMNALAWVESQLQAMGYTTVRHTFTSNTGGTNLWATKMGSVTPTEMYMVAGHLDARSGGDGFDDDGSGVALVLEVARVLAGSDVTTDKSVRFIFWDKEETGLNGSAAYASNNTATGGRRTLQGTLDEPTWLGLIQHDMILYDHGAGSPGTQQSAYADLDVEWRAGTAKEADSKALALKWAYAEGQYAPDYPATAYNYSTNTDDTSFQPYVASISVRENRRSLTSGTNAEWINPYYHTTNDKETSYQRDDDGDGKRDDIELGYNAVRTTLGLVAELAGAHIVTPTLTLAKSAGAAWYRATGEIITYTYLITNTGNVTLDAPFAVADDRATVACPATSSLAPAASITCSAAYTITQADLDAGALTNHAAASATFGGNPVSSNTASATITYTACPGFVTPPVDAGALQVLAGLWRQDVTGTSYDIDGDGVVTVVDIMWLAARWGSSTCQ